MGNLKFKQKRPLIIVLLTSVLLLFIFWYRDTYVTEHNNIQEINSSHLDRKLLIASVSSPFKDSIKTKIINRYHSPSIVVEVINLKDLKHTKTESFDAILIMHRWEAGAPIESVQSFIDENLNLKNKIVMLTTSWNGLEKTENIDAITGASIINDVPFVTDKIIKKLDQLLKYNN